MTKVATGSAMTPIWFLTSVPDSLVGKAYVIEPEDFNSSNNVGEGFDVFGLSPAPANDAEGKSALLRDAEYASQLTHQLLYYEKVVDRAFIIGSYRFPGTDKQDLNNIVGHSAQLAFALATVVGMAKYFNKDLQDKQVSPGIAATGLLNDNCEVLKVEGVPQKLRAILKEQKKLQELPHERNYTVFFFYPLTNQADIDQELKLEAKSHNIELKPVQHLIEALNALNIDIKQGYLKEPYRGLDSFEYQHRSIYYGRNKDIESLRDKLLNQEHDQKPGILILGASGSGKSSLVQAGLLPALIEPCLIREQPALKNTRTEWCLWRPRDIITLQENIGEPKSFGEAEGCRSVQANWVQYFPELSDLGKHTTFNALADAWQNAWPNEKRFVWIVDQLEELFTLGLPEEFVTAFCHFLGTMQKRSVWVVATLRDDFYAQYLQQDILVAVFPHNQTYPLRKLDSAALKNIIEEPAKKAKLVWDVDVNDISLNDQLLVDMLKSSPNGDTADALPLLEFALNKLFNKRDGSKLTFDAYNEMGRLHGAIGEEAENTFETFIKKYSQKLEVPEAVLARVIRALTIYQNGSGTARPERLDTFPEGSADRDLINELINARLLAFGDQTQTNTPRTIRVAHEALLTHWVKAKNIIEQSKNDLILRDRLEQEAARWSSAESYHQPDLLLPAGRKLNEANEWMEQLGEEERLVNEAIISYINASNQAEEKRQKDKRKAEQRKLKNTQIWAAFLTLLAGVALFFYYVADKGKQEAKQQLAESFFRQGAQLALENNPREALAYLAQAIRTNGDENSATLAASLLTFEIKPYLISLPHETGHVISNDFSPDGLLVVTAAGNTASLWGAATGELVSTMSHAGHVSSAEFTPKNNWVVTGERDDYDFKTKATHVWDENGKHALPMMVNQSGLTSAKLNFEDKVLTAQDRYAMIRDYSTGMPISIMVHNEQVNYAEFSHDSRWVVTSAGNIASLWDPAKSQLVSEMFHEEHVNSAKFSPNGRWIVTLAGKTASVWDASTNLSRKVLTIREVDSVEFSPDGGRVVTTANEKNEETKVWDVHTGKNILQLPMSKDVVYARFSPEGRSIVTTSKDGIARVWNAETRKPVSAPMVPEKLESTHFIEPYDSFDGLEKGRSAKLSPDGHLVVTSHDSNTYIWNSDTYQLFSSLNFNKEEVNSVVSSLDGRWVVTTYSDDTARVWDVASGQSISKPMPHKGLKYAAFSPNGRLVVTAALDGTARVWDVATGQPISEPMAHEGLRFVSLSPSGRLMVTAAVDGTAHVWDIATGKQVSIKIPHKKPVKYAEFSANELWVITASFDGTARVWNTTTGQPVSGPMVHNDASFEDHNRRFSWGVISAKFSPDGSRVVTASFDGTAVVWDVATGKRISKPMTTNIAGQYFGMNDATFSPDGLWVVTASENGIARVWEAATGNPVSAPMEFTGHRGYTLSFSYSDWESEWDFSSAYFSHDGRRVVTASSDGTARIWDAATGKPVSAPMVHDAAIKSAVLSHDGHWLFTISDYKVVMRWDLVSLRQASMDFASFLDRISGCSLIASNGLTCSHSTSLPELRALLEKTHGLNPEEHRFLEWLLGDSHERTLSPNQSESIHSRVDRLIADDNFNSLNEALNIWPMHPLALVRLAEYSVSNIESEQWAKLGLTIAPDDPDVRSTAGRILSRQARFGRLTLPMGELLLREDDHAVSSEQYVATPKAFDPPGLSDTVRSGLAFLRGDGVKQDFNQGVALLQKAAAAGENYAEYQLARAQSYGVGMQQNETEACHRFTHLTENSLPQIQNSLGSCYRDSILTDNGAPDFDQARAWYEKAAVQNYPEAIYILGIMALNSEGFNESPSLAADYFRRAAGLGDDVAALNLAELYEQGKGVNLSIDDAITWYRKATELGNSEALLRLASFYETGTYLQKSLEQTVTLYRQAALSGHPIAQFKLATLIRDGKTTDSHDAVYWFTQAAQQGSPAGQFALGLLYELGEGVKKNPTEAHNWYQRVLDAKLPEDDQLCQEAELRNGQKGS